MIKFFLGTLDEIEEKFDSWKKETGFAVANVQLFPIGGNEFVLTVLF